MAARFRNSEDQKDMTSGFTSTANNSGFTTKSKRKKNPPRLHRQKAVYRDGQTFTNIHTGYSLDGTGAG